MFLLPLAALGQDDVVVDDADVPTAVIEENGDDVENNNAPLEDAEADDGDATNAKDGDGDNTNVTLTEAEEDGDSVVTKDNYAESADAQSASGDEDEDHGVPTVWLDTSSMEIQPDSNDEVTMSEFMQLFGVSRDGISPEFVSVEIYDELSGSDEGFPITIVPTEPLAKIVGVMKEIEMQEGGYVAHLMEENNEMKKQVALLKKKVEEQNDEIKLGEGRTKA